MAKGGMHESEYRFAFLSAVMLLLRSVYVHRLSPTRLSNYPSLFLALVLLRPAPVSVLRSCASLFSFRSFPRGTGVISKLLETLLMLMLLLLLLLLQLMPVTGT